MASGLQIRNANGEVVWDSSIRPTEIIGTCYASTSNGNTPYDSRITSDNYWMYITSFTESLGDGYGYTTPDFYAQGGYIYWNWDRANGLPSQAFTMMYNKKSPFYFVYGVYR